MTAQILTMLRTVDPCPDDVAYPESVAQRNIDAIVRADLTVRTAVAARPSRRRRNALSAVAAVVVLVAGAGAVVGVETSRDRVSTPPAADVWVSFSGSGVTFEHPGAWTSYPPAVSSTTSTGLALLSTATIPPVCSTSTDVAGTETLECHRPDPDLTQGGVLVDWTAHGFPGWELATEPGVDASLDGYPARVDRTDFAPECEGTGAVRSIQVAIASSAQFNWLSMTACVGPGDVEADLAAVDRMLASVRVER